MKYILGIDLGTTSCKATLLSDVGGIFSTQIKSNSIKPPQTEWSEQNPEEWWGAVQDVIRQIIFSASCKGEDILGISISGQMHGLVLLDKNFQILRPAILWNDMRSISQCNFINSKIPNIEKITLNKNIPAFTLSKLLWVRDNEPEIYKKINKVLLPKDYIRFKLTGKIVTEPSDASGTSMFDVRNISWSNEIVDTLGIPREWLPECVSSSSIVGSMLPSVAVRLGLSPMTVILAGAGDQAAQAFGVGVVSPSIIGISIGTSGVIVNMRNNPVFGSFCHVIPNSWLQLNSMHSAGLCIEWFHRAFLSEISYQEMFNSLENVSNKNLDLFFLPFLSGERIESQNTVPASFIGIKYSHTIGHFVIAAMEGVGFEFRRMLDQWIGDGLVISEVRLSGGGAKNKIWQSIISNVLDLPIYYVNRDASFGMALFCGEMLGMWKKNEIDKMFPYDPYLIKPDKALSEVYESRYQQYYSLYQLFSEPKSHKG